MGYEEKIQELQSRRNIAKAMGGEKKIAEQHEKGKLNVRERLDLLFDEGTFREMGILASHQSQNSLMEGKITPADGSIVGYGKIDGRVCCVIATDYTVMAGTIGTVGELKGDRAREWALKNRVPIVYLIDSAGARVNEAHGSAIIGGAGMFFEQSVMSGVVPQVCALMGPGAAGTAYLPALSDFTIMVKGTSHMSLAGPPLVKAVIGEVVTAEELGGSKIHCEVSGVADLEVENDVEAIEAVKKYLSYFPSHNQGELPIKETTDPRDRELTDIVEKIPENNRVWDMYTLIEAMVDEKEYFDVKPKYARNMITCFARMGGRPVGIIANQSKFKGGTIDIDAADKAARFMMICNAYRIPLIFLVDNPAFLPGTNMERQGIIRHGAKMLHMVSIVTVPKLVIVVRKAYGGGMIVMSAGKRFQPDLLVAWPGAEISVTGAEGATDIIFGKEIAKAEDPVAYRNQKIQEFKRLTTPYLAASQVMIDDVIHPAETRKILIEHLELTKNKNIERAWRVNSIMPV